jgi:hypothetical protein
MNEPLTFREFMRAMKETLATPYWKPLPPTPIHIAGRFARPPKGGQQGSVVFLAPGEVIVTPERAEQLGLTADARRMRREQTDR